MLSPNEIRQQITAQLIEALTNGELPPWRRPWTNDANAGLHTSLSTGNPYRGINQLLLQVAAARSGFQSKWWATFNQIRNSGAHVLKGQKGTQVIFYKPVTRTRIDENGDENEDSFCVLRQFVVFNAEQVNGLEQFRVGNATLDTQEIESRFGQAERVIAATNADIRFGGNKAFYSPDGDFIQCPFRQQFESPEAYYETLGHELVHWSEKRIGFDRSQAENTYALAELVAEIGSCFLMSELGLATTDNLTNHAAYLQSWLRGMSGDSRFIFKAAALAAKAIELVLGFSRIPADSAEPALA